MSRRRQTTRWIPAACFFGLGFVALGILVVPPLLENGDDPVNAPSGGEENITAREEPERGTPSKDARDSPPRDDGAAYGRTRSRLPNAPGAAAPRRLFSIRVLSGSGRRPLRGAWVTVEIPGVGRFRGKTGSNGEAPLRLPSRFKGWAIVAAEGLAAVRKDLRIGGEAASLEVELSGSEEPRFTLRAVEGGEGSPLPDATVTLSDNRYACWMETGPGGEITVPMHLFRLPIHVEAEREGYHLSRGVLRKIPAGSSVNFPLFPDTPLVLTLLSPRGTPVPGVLCRLQVLGDGWRGNILAADSNEAGEARFTGFPLGDEVRCHFTGEHDDYLSFRGDFTPVELRRNRGAFRIDLSEGVVVRAVLRGGPPGDPPSIAEYRPADPVGGGMPEGLSENAKSVEIDDEGGFPIRVRPGGKVALRIRRGSEVLAVTEKFVTPGRVVSVDVGTPGRAVVVVQDPEGRRLPEVRVVIRREDPGFEPVRMEGRTDASGRCFFLGAVPGSYHGAAEVPGRGERAFAFHLTDAGDHHVPVVLPAHGK
ncbi:MAG: hypothetical protein ACYS47_12285 [Planctomycetota bacterium]|jgi:hypothetical protein